MIKYHIRGQDYDFIAITVSKQSREVTVNQYLVKGGKIFEASSTRFKTTIVNKKVVVNSVASDSRVLVLIPPKCIDVIKKGTKWVTECDTLIVAPKTQMQVEKGALDSWSGLGTVRVFDNECKFELGAFPESVKEVII